MRPGWVLLILLTLLPVAARDALAAGGTGPLLLAKPQQWLDATYQITGEQQSTTSLQQTVREEYNFKIDYAVARPSLLRGTAAIKLIADQQFFSSGGSSSEGYNVGLGYNFGGALFTRSRAPGSFTISSNISEVTNSFARSYQLKNNNYGVQWSLANRILPASLRYSTGTTESSGQPVDSKNVYDEIALHAGHTRGISSTGFDVSRMQNSYSTTQGTGADANHVELKLSNDLRWVEGEKLRDLSSTLNVTDSSGISKTSNLGLSESLNWAWGRALSSSAGYTHATSGGDAGTQTSNAGQLSLGHSLGTSLRTQATANLRRDDLPAGHDQEAGGKISVDYSKLLPGESSLALNGFNGYAIEDRDLGTGLAHVFNEPHTVTFGIRIFLAQPNIVAPGITVRNADPLIRITPYVLNIDYRIDTVGTQTEIVPLAGGAIVDGNLLLVSYDYQVDSFVKLRKESQGVGGTISLFEGRYRVHGDFIRSRQDPIAGVSLVGQTFSNSAHLRFERKWATMRLVTGYENIDSSYDNHQSVSAKGTYSASAGRGYLSVTLGDLYQWYGQTTAGNVAVQREPENDFDASVTYRRRIMYGGSLRLTMDYSNISGATRSDRFVLNADMHWTFGKLVVTLTSTLGFRRQQGTVSNNENLRLQLTRYF